MYLRHIVLLVALVAGQALASDDCSTSITCGHWVTKRVYPGGTMRLNWTHVYEGLDSIFRIDFPVLGNRPTQLKVWGQPIFNNASTFVALLVCADDGCQQKLTFIDLENRTEIGAPTLPYSRKQIYLKGNWQGDVFVLKASISDDDKEKIVTHRYRVTSNSISEMK
jgi:hypothetical protein